MNELVTFGRELSVAFQVTDDLLNVRADPQEYGKEIGGDLWEGKRTLILLHALRTTSASERGRAVEILSRPRPPSDKVAQVQDLLDHLVRLEQLTPVGRAELEQAVWGGPTTVKTLAEVQWLSDLVRRQGSIDYAAGAARRHAEAAATRLEGLERLSPSPHRAVIEGLVRYVHERSR